MAGGARERRLRRGDDSDPERDDGSVPLICPTCQPSMFLVGAARAASKDHCPVNSYLTSRRKRSSEPSAFICFRTAARRPASSACFLCK
jgi:hypothetical protein